MTEWTKVAPKRFDNAIVALARIERTAGKGYDVPAIEAAVMLDKLHVAVASVVKAYGLTPKPAPDEDDSPAPTPARRPVLKIADQPHQLQIGTFVAEIPAAHVTAFVTHLMNRLCEGFNRREDV